MLNKQKLYLPPLNNYKQKNDKKKVKKESNIDERNFPILSIHQLSKIKGGKSKDDIDTPPDELDDIFG